MPQPEKVILSVVLLSYNSRSYLEKFLPVLISNTGPDHEIVVVNNGSTDDTEEYLQKNFPRIRTIKIARNKGFTNGYVQALREIDAKYYCLISSDIEVTAGWAEPVVQLMEADDRIAACQPKIKSWHRRSEFEYAGACGGYLDKYGYLFCRGRIFYTVEEDRGQYNDNREIFWASGACLFVRADLYHESGGLDDDFFAHMEEVDLCWRLRNMGYKIMAVPASEVYHVGGSIISYGSAPKTYRNYRNNLILLTKNLPAGQLLWKLPYRLFLDGIAFFHLALTGNFSLAFTILKSHFHFHIRLPHWFASRRKARKLAVADSGASFYQRSIVWDYFIRRIRYFSELDWRI